MDKPIEITIKINETDGLILSGEFTMDDLLIACDAFVTVTAGAHRIQKSGLLEFLLKNTEEQEK